MHNNINIWRFFVTTNDQTPPRLSSNTVKKTPGQKKTKKGPIIFGSLSLLLLILLGIILILVSSDHQSGLAATVFPRSPKASRQDTPTLTLTPSSTPTSSPTPSPVQSLPHTLAAQITDLEAHDRFFYHGNTRLPEIALTFDDGPNPENTPQILAILRQYHVRATFFDVGRLVKRYPDLAKQEIADGHIVGNHSWSHPYLPSLTPGAIRKQIANTSDIIQQVTGIRPIFFRPPYGALTADALAVINSFGLTTIIWNNDARDWSIPGISVISARVLTSASNGAIILLHDGGGDRYQTIAALPTIIEHLRALNYQFVTMAHLVADYHGKKALPALMPAPTPYAGYLGYPFQSTNNYVKKKVLKKGSVRTETTEAHQSSMEWLPTAFLLLFSRCGRADDAQRGVVVSYETVRQWCLRVWADIREQTPSPPPSVWGQVAFG